MFHFCYHKFEKIHALMIRAWRTGVFYALCRTGFINVSIGKGVRVNQRVTVMGRGRISIGDGVHLGVYPSPGFKRGEFYLEARSPSARIVIEDHVLINNNAILIADKSAITVGERTLIGPNFVCFDSDFHPLDPVNRLSNDYSCIPVVIESNAFIGEGVKVLKGGRIAKDQVVGAGQIVRAPRA
jgi:maltose O-acetyltransferase